MTGAPIASLPLSTPADVVVAVRGARAAQRAWARTLVELRSAIMLRFHDLDLERADRCVEPDEEAREDVTVAAPPGASKGEAEAGPAHGEPSVRLEPARG
jgi:hypothetical protein